MKLSIDCMYCLISRQQEIVMGKAVEEDVKAGYMREVLRLIADAPEDINAPVLTVEISRLSRRYFGESYSFEDLKKEYNTQLLAMEADIRARIGRSTDPLLTAVKLARAGNYIDFGAMHHVEDEKLNRLLEQAEGEELDPLEYAAFVHDLEGAGRLAYLTDNCGEIVLDKLLIEVIRQRFPALAITVVTRGLPILNDATCEDAEAVGLPALARVIGNGTEIAGTHLPAVDAEARSAILSADLIIAKGQGNFETLHGCGLNIYYLFLCKCDMFVRRFRLERFKGVFLNEKNCRAAMEISQSM